MTLQDLLNTNPRRVKLTVKQAAAIMDVTPRLLQMGLQQGRFPFGVGVEMDSWVYWISSERFIKYMTGGE